MGDFTNLSPARLYERFHFSIADGVMHHRAVDKNTDKHQAVNESVGLLFSRHRHYARVILDVCYDYFLLRNWHKFSDVKPEVFIHRCYDQLTKALSSDQPFPPRFALFINKFVSCDLLTTYRTLDGVDLALSRIATRIARPTNLDRAVDDIRRCHDMIEASFLQLFPSLLRIKYQRVVKP